METKRYIIIRNYNAYAGTRDGTWATYPDWHPNVSPRVFSTLWEADQRRSFLENQSPNNRYYVHKLTEDESREITFLKLCNG